MTAESRVVLPNDIELRSIFGDARTVAIVGLSANPERDSHRVAAYLQRKGYRIIPVNPNIATVLGEPAYGRLQDVPFPIDVVDVFRRAELTPAIAREAVAVGAKVLWLQEGIYNGEAQSIAMEGGLSVIMGACMKHVDEQLEEDVDG